MKKFAKIAGIVAAVALVVLLAAPFLVNANQFRPTLEAALSKSLGREVKIGDLRLSILSGSVTANDLSVADDPAFGSAPFVRAKSLRVGVELWPLISARKANVTGLTIEEPEIVLLQSGPGAWNFSTLGVKSAATAGQTPAPGKGLDLAVKLVKITDGRVSLGKTGGRTKPLLLENVNAELRDFSATSVMPFSLTAAFEGDGQVKIDGKAGPLDPGDVVFTPINASAKITHLDAVASGLIDPSLGLGGLLSITANTLSNGKSLDVSGNIKAEKLKLVKGGSPAPRPLDIEFSLTHDLHSGAGLLKRCNLSAGRAAANLAGLYSTKNELTALKVNLSGLNMPVEDLESFLPALNVRLPSGSSLHGGTATVRLALEGPLHHLVADGFLGVNGTRLAGFDLGLKLSTVQKLAGIKEGPNTEIETLSTNLRANQDGGATLSNLKLVAPAIGELSGGGTISASNALDFKMSAAIRAGGVMAALGRTSLPFTITGTASNPIFRPDVKALAGQQLNRVKGDAAKTAIGILDGFLDNKKKK
jgi:AsmA protein